MLTWGAPGAADHIVDLTTRYTRSGKPFFTVEADGRRNWRRTRLLCHRPATRDRLFRDGQRRLAGVVHQTGINLPAAVTPPGMDSPARLVGFGGPGSSKPLPPLPPEYEAKALSQAFLTLSQIAPQILEHQASGTIAGVALDKQRPDEKVKLGNYILNVGLPPRPPRAGTRRSRRLSATVYSWRPARTSTCWRAIIC